MRPPAIKPLRVLAPILAVLAGSAVTAQGRAVTASVLAGLKFDTVAVLVTDKNATSDLLDALNDAAGGLSSKCSDNEVIVWQGNGYSRARSGSIINNTTARLAKVGYTYKPSPKQMDGTTAISFFSALSPSKSLAGVWVVDDKSMVLAWCKLVPLKPLDKSGPPDDPDGSSGAETGSGQGR